MKIPPVRVVPCLVPNTLDFGAVQPNDRVGGMAGVCNWSGAGQVTAAILNDNSGGLFTGFTLGVYDVEASFPGGGGGGPPQRLRSGIGGPRPAIPRPPQWYLVPVATGDGTQPLPVAPGQTVAVSLFFNAPAQSSGKPYTAEILIWSGGAVAATIPVTAIVEAPDFTGEWILANPFGIETESLSTIDPLIGVWNTGHVNDAIVMQSSGALLVATDAGGIWLVQQPGSSVSPMASPLTNDWDSNLTTCLAQGPHGPDHFYVGTQGALYETDDLFATSRDISPPGVGYVYRIVVTNANPRRIVVACDSSVLWSTIPLPGGAYQWTQVTKQANGAVFPAGTYSGLALSRNVDLSDRIVAAAYGVNAVSGLYGIFYGDWSTGSLVLTAVPDANMPPVPPQSLIKFAEGMYRTSLASCSSQPNVMYAVASNPQPPNTKPDKRTIYAVLKSTDGGITWKLAPGTQALSEQAGAQGGYNNCIAVAPTAPTRLLIGWESGTFQSRDSGSNFAALSYPGLHDDVHGLYFDPADSTNDTFYICSDGGLAKTQDGGKTFDTNLNRYLADLECYCAIPRNFWGSLSVRGNLMTTGLQDNGNIYCALRPGNTPDVSPWVWVDGGDGGWVALIATGQLISTPLSGTSSAFLPRTDAPLEFIPLGTVPVRDQNGDDKTGLVAFAVEPVATPAYANMAGQNMYAVARGQRTTETATGAGLQNVYGLFAYSGGNDLHWEEIGTIASDLPGDAINAVATLDDGTSALVGTVNGRIFLLRPLPGGPVAGQKMVVSLPPQITQGRVDRMVFSLATLAFATFNTNGAGHMLRFDGTAWSLADSGLPGTNLFGLARDGYYRTWTCTDDKVWVSLDDGFSWKDASLGLPRRPHCAELRYNFVQQNPPLIYLSTYGHSVRVASVIG